MDIMFTWIVLFFGGREVNGLAAHVIERYDLVGMVLFKFAMMTVALVTCELVGRQREATGRRLARFGIAVTCFPVFVAIVQLMAQRPWEAYVAGA